MSYRTVILYMDRYPCCILQGEKYLFYKEKNNFFTEDFLGRGKLGLATLVFSQTVQGKI